MDVTCLGLAVGSEVGRRYGTRLGFERCAERLLIPRGLEALVHLIAQRAYRGPRLSVGHRVIELRPSRLKDGAMRPLVRDRLPDVLGEVRNDRRERGGDGLDGDGQHGLARAPARFGGRGDVQPVLGDVEVEVGEVGGHERLRQQQGQVTTTTRRHPRRRRRRRRRQAARGPAVRRARARTGTRRTPPSPPQPPQ